MAKLWAVFRREYVERVRSKWFLLGTLLGPVFFVLVAGAPRLLGDQPEGTRDLAHIEVIDASGSGLGARIVEALRARYPLSRAPYLTVVEVSEARSDWAPDPANPLPKFTPPRRVPHGVTLIGRLFDEGTIGRVGIAMERALGAVGERPSGF